MSSAVREALEGEEQYDGLILFEEQSYDDAFLGVTKDNRAVYDFDKMVDWLVRYYEMSEEDAVDFIDHNDGYSGENEPIIVCMPVVLKK